LEFRAGVGRRVRPNSSLADCNSLQEKGGKPRLRVGPLSGGDGAAAIVVAAAGIANYVLEGDGDGRCMAGMRRFARTTCMRRCGGNRKRNWDEVSREREEQQPSGGQAVHAEPN